MSCEKVCMRKPPGGGSGGYLYFYTRVIEDFRVDINLTLLQADVLKIVNITPSPLHKNNWAFV